MVARDFVLSLIILYGELCALKWSDINQEDGSIRINKTVQRIKSFNGNPKTIVAITTPKSGKSVREIPLPGFITDLLRPAKFSDSYFLSGSDKLIEPRLMQYHFKHVLEKANLPSMNFHITRHIFATNCISSGFDIKTLSEILGHASVEITLNRYVHTSRGRKQECMALLQFF